MHRRRRIGEKRTLEHSINDDVSTEMNRSLRATVSSFTLSKTSTASVSFTNARENVSKVLEWNVRGHWPWSVWGKRVTSEINGYGTWEVVEQHEHLRGDRWTCPQFLVNPALELKD